MAFYRVPPGRTSYGGPGFGIPAVTPTVRALLIALGAVWAAQFVIDRMLHLLPIPLTTLFGLVPELVVRGFVWQPVTYMWLHSVTDPFHVLLNMLLLWMIGGDLERHWGARRFLTYYLICGIGAGLFVLGAGLLTNPMAVTVGASGALYGLILAFGTIFADRTILFMMIFPMRARTFAIILFAIAFLFTWSPDRSGVSHVAHLGGMIVGFLVLKRAWRVGDLVRGARWRVRRRRFRVMDRRDEDRWVN